MQAAATPPLPPPRRRVYTAVDPRCEWRSTEEADTLVVDVSGKATLPRRRDRTSHQRACRLRLTHNKRLSSIHSGFKKDELKVVYSVRRKKLKATGGRQPDGAGAPRLKVTGERRADGGRWARFLKVVPMPRSCDAGTIQARLDTERAQLSVVLPKPKGSSSSSSKDRQKERHPAERAHSLEELMRADTAGGSSGRSDGSMRSAQEDAGNGKVEDKEQKQDRHQAMEEPRHDQAMNVQDLPGGDGGQTENAARNNDGDGKGEDGRWWRKIRYLRVLSFLLVLALVGVGATVLYIALL